MSDYSIELAAERIVDPRTKRYFAEVYGCYTTGHYRSAVVMLWSVVVTDVLFKLDQLANAYSDATAQAILTEIENIRKSNPKSPEWEALLVDKVATRTDLLDPAEHSFLQSLQDHRHLSAHPVMTSSAVLFSPNKETARAHIRNVLDGVLTKPPIMSRKIFDTFIEDVEQVAKLGSGRVEMTKYLEAKYFRHFSPATFAHIFKSLWRVTFKSTDARCDANRDVNAQALEVVFAKHRVELARIISTEREWFSDVALVPGALNAMTSFFRTFYEVYPLLTDAVKMPIQKFADLSLDNFSSCWFVSDSPEAHMDEVIRRIDEDEVLSGEAFGRLCSSLSTSDAIRKVYHAGIRLYCQSCSFDTADTRFQEVIKPCIAGFSKEHFEAFLVGCDTCYNGQAISRGRATRDHRELKKLWMKGFPKLIWISIQLSKVQLNSMPTPSEHKTVQSCILAYAEAIGWTIVPREEAEQHRGFDPDVPSAAGKFNNNSGTLKKMFVPVPAINQQEEIVRTLSLVDDKTNNSILRKSSLHDLFRALLDELMIAKTRVHKLEPLS
jgi:hypothetical protein